MKADEIREFGRNLRVNNGVADKTTWADGSAQTAVLIEIAAQLAEANQYLKMCAYPLMVFEGADVGPDERMGFSDKLPQPIMLAMKPRATLRDQFAMAVMPTFINRAREADNSYWSIMTCGGGTPTEDDLERLAKESRNTRDTMVRQAYQWVDAMMEARK